MEVIRLRFYLSKDGTNLFDRWLIQLGSPAAAARIEFRLAALRAGSVVNIDALKFNAAFA